MSYYISKTLSRPFDAVVADVTARLKEQGFGLLTDIDVQATLKSRIGADIAKYRILGACNRWSAPGLQASSRLLRKFVAC